MNTRKFTEYKFTQRYGMEATGDMWKQQGTKEGIEQEEGNFSQYVEECKAKGIYGQEYTTIINVEQDPIFDESGEKTTPTEIYKSEIMYFNRNGNKI